LGLPVVPLVYMISAPAPSWLLPPALPSKAGPGSPSSAAAAPLLAVAVAGRR
jgi:hypothetical protein